MITEGVTPSLHIDYKHAVIKQYHKEGRALRTETTINDTRDFQIGKRLTNLPALREIGLSANRRLLGVQRLSHNPIRAAEAFTAVHQPIITDTGHRIAGLRLARPPRARSPPSTAGIPAAPERVPQPRPTRPARRTARPRPDQRRPDELRPATAPAHGLITRIPRSHRYRLTEIGLHHAMLLSHIHTRLLQPGLAHLTDPDPPEPSTLRTAAHNYRRALDQLTQDAGLAA